MSGEVVGDILKAVAPGIATALFGPLAGAAISFIASKFGTEATAEAVNQRLANLTAADMVRMKELDLEFQQNMAEIGIKLQLAQIGVNTEEAKSENLFVAGWRPAVGWVGAIGLAYVAVLEPIGRFIAKVGFSYTGSFPVIDTSLTMQVLSGLIGFGIMRSFDKAKTTSNGH